MKDWIYATLIVMVLAACQTDKTTDRWVTTENTTVKIDWDAIGKAYKAASGPKDFEKRVNEIYTGKEVISISVQDQSAARQTVTGFFDKDKDGAVDEGEKIFSLTRTIDSGTKKGSYAIHGHGHYGHYRSPAWDIAEGMIIGSMISNAMRPNYVPVYTQPYTTAPARVQSIRSERRAYRTTNAKRFEARRAKARPTPRPAASRPKAKRSSSGRSYGGKGNKWGSRPSRSSGRTGGSRFRARRKRCDVLRLES